MSGGSDELILGASTEQSVAMSRARRLVPTVLIALVVAAGVGACSQPEPNPPVKITGKETEAVPTTGPTTTTSTSTTTTTLFYGLTS